LPVADGSVRAVCDATDPPTDVRAFAFDAGGRSMAGWPVQLRPGHHTVGRVVGDVLMTFTDSTMTTIAADGAIQRGVRVPNIETCCGDEWAVGPDGIAYGVVPVSGFTEGSAEVSRIAAVDLSGMRSGWPVNLDGMASGPAFGPDGKIMLTVGSFAGETSRVLVFGPGGKAVSALSAKLPIDTAETGVDCTPGSPEPPVVARDGTTFVFSEIDSAVYALDPSLKVMGGWPYRASTPLVHPGWNDPRYDIPCAAIGRPAVGPGNVLYMPLRARNASVGQRIVAVGPDGRPRAGWPVELRRSGAEVYSVVVGSDGTVYAMAVEPETAGGSSATVLAVSPDSTVLYRTTIMNP
jgi:outer membrane protein assembly factor BamB